MYNIVQSFYNSKGSIKLATKKTCIYITRFFQYKTRQHKDSHLEKHTYIYNTKRQHKASHQK